MGKKVSLALRRLPPVQFATGYLALFFLWRAHALSLIIVIYEAVRGLRLTDESSLLHYRRCWTFGLKRCWVFFIISLDEKLLLLWVRSQWPFTHTFSSLRCIPKVLILAWSATINTFQNTSQCRKRKCKQDVAIWPYIERHTKLQSFFSRTDTLFECNFELERDCITLKKTYLKDHKGPNPYFICLASSGPSLS